MIHASYNGDNLSLSQQDFLSGDKKAGCCNLAAMQKGRSPHTAGTVELMKKTGQRLAVLADLHAMGPTEMTRCLDLAHGQWRLMVNGERPLSIEKAMRVCDQFKVSLDWLYRGVPSASVDPDVLANVVALRPDLTELRHMAGNKGKEPVAGKALTTAQSA